MKKLLIGTLTILTITSSFSQSINIGSEALNYFLVDENSIIYAVQDQLILLNLNTLKETRITVKSSKSQAFKTYITKFKILHNKDIAIINNEPSITLYNPLKNTKKEIPFNINQSQEPKNIFLTRFENAEDLDVSNSSNYIWSKTHVFKLFLGLFPIEDYYEYSLYLYPSLQILKTFISKEILIEGSILFSPKDSFIIFTNVSYSSQSDKFYGISIYDIKKQKIYNLLENTPVISLDITDNDELLAISTEENYSKIFDLRTLKEIFSYPISGNIKFSPKNDLLLIEGVKTISLFNIKNRELISSYLGSNPSLSPNQTYIAYSLSKDFTSLSKEIVILNRVTNTERKIFLKEDSFIEDIKFSLDEKLLILMLSGKDGYKIEIYKI